MRIIYCDSVIDNKIVDPDYEQEMISAKQSGFNVSLISFEELTDGNISKALKLVPIAETEEQAIYRGWMLKPKQYESLYEGLILKKIRLINTPNQYQHCHYLPLSYSVIESKTPFTRSIEINDEIDYDQIYKETSVFGDSPIIVKDYVKSLKHYWKEACFIPDASNKEHVKSVVSRFVELQGNSLNKGLVFRKYESLEFLAEHSQSGMPLTLEYRLFFLNNALVQTFQYWDEGDYSGTEPEINEFLDIAKSVESNFFTMDIAKKENGEWIILELGDAQVAGLPDNANKFEFYSALT